MSTQHQTRLITKMNKVIAMDSKSMKQAYDRYTRGLLPSLSTEIRPHAGIGAVQKYVKAAIGGTGVGEATASPGGDNVGGGDDDSGDGDADGDGPRRSSQPLHHSSSSSPSSRRPLLPRPLSGRAVVWLLTLALLLAYLAPPGFAALFIQLGQPALASEMLRYKPVFLLPVPLGWSKSD